MTVRESNALISHRNDEGDREILYPITLSDYVDGLDEKLDKKVSKEDGKGLSQYDFDESSKEKLESIEYGAEVNVQSDWLERNVSSPAYIKNKPEIKEGERYTLSKKGKDIVLKGSNGTLSSAENIIYEHPESGVVSGTYKSVVVDSNGHVTNGTNPTTLEGYGITNADKLGSADKALSAAKSYTDSKISSLIGGAPETLDTLEEVANAIENNKSVVDALNSAIGEKVSKVEGKGLSTNDLSDELKSNYDSAYAHSQENHAPSNAQENVIESIKLNGTSVAPVSKVVNITSEGLGIGDVAEVRKDVEGVKEAISKKTARVYSFHINGNESSPSDAVTYLDDSVGMTPVHMDFENNTFDYGTWENAFFMPKPCMVKYDGTLDYYLDPNDYTKKIDGTTSDIANIDYEGNAMIEWGGGGKIWYKIVPDDEDDSSATIFFSNAQMDSDYVDWSFHNYKGENIDKFYTPIYNGSTDGTRIRSMSGQVCIQSKTAQQEVDLAKANNVDGNSIWYTEILSDVQLVNLLLVLIGKSLDTQSVFGRGNDSGRVYDSSQNYGMLNSGTMDTKGMFWGSNDKTSGVKVFGMENWWGNQWRRYAGDINDNGAHKIKYTYGVEDGSTEIGFNTTGQGYKLINEALPSANIGHIQEMKFAKDGMSPLIASGTISTYYCDGLWTNTAQVNYALHGGYCGVGAICGAFCLGLNTDPTFAAWNLGASLSCKPSNKQKIASTTEYGNVKLSSESNVSDSIGLALPTTEKNPNIDGTLANQISQLNTNLNNFKIYTNPNQLELVASDINSLVEIIDKMPNQSICFFSYSTNEGWGAKRLVPINYGVLIIFRGINNNKVRLRCFDANSNGTYSSRYNSANSDIDEWYEIGSTGGGGHVVSSTAPTDTKLLWVDTGNGGIVKYYNGSSWVPTASTWR